MGGAAGGRRHSLAGLGSLAAALLLAACGGASPGAPALPEGFLALGIPNVDLNAYAYVRADETMTLRANADDARDSLPPLTVTTVEAALQDPDDRWAARLEFTDAQTAEDAAAALAPGGTDGALVAKDETTLTVGRMDNDWGERLRDAWRTSDRVSLEARYPEAWEALRLLPESPPVAPVAVGFGRNVADLFDQLLGTAEVITPSLSDALGLVRVSWVAFAGYSDSLGPLPDAGRRGLLGDLDAGVVFVAQASYPSVVVDAVFAQFADGVQLQEVEVGASTAHYRPLHDGLHLFVKNYGTSFFFVAGPTRASAETLMASVIDSQSGR